MFKAKKILVLMLLVLLSVSVIACTSTPETTGEVEGQAQGEIKPEGIWQNVQIVTEEYPPLNYTDQDGNLTGTSTRNVLAAMDKLGIELPIHVYPWARAYEMAQEEEDVLIYSMGRTEEREELFKWISPIGAVEVHLYALKSRDDIEVDILEDAKSYTIGSTAEDYSEQRLKGVGFEEQIVSSPNQNQSIRQLFEERVDLWIATVSGEDLERLCEQEGYDASELQKVLTVEEFEVEAWIAASLGTSDEVVELFRNAIEN